MIVAFDLARLFVGPLAPTPRGIDRVDLAYGRYFLEHWGGDCVGVLPTPWGVRWFSRERSLRVVNFIEDYWRETDEPAADPAYQWVKDRLQDRSPSILPPKPQASAVRLARGVSRFFRQHGFAFGSPVATLPAGTVYINTGQIVLAVPRLVSWLASRQDVKPVFMLHDAIPIENPEYTPAYTSRAHGQMLVSTARFAHGLIVTTQAAGKSIKRELARLGCHAIPVIAAALPVPLPFLKPFAIDPDLRDFKLLRDLRCDRTAKESPAAPQCLARTDRSERSESAKARRDRLPMAYQRRRHRYVGEMRAAQRSRH